MKCLRCLGRVGRVSSICESCYSIMELDIMSKGERIKKLEDENKRLKLEILRLQDDLEREEMR